MNRFAQGPAFEIARRIELRGSATWVAVIGSHSTPEPSELERLCAELESLTNRQTRVLSVAGREPLEIREVLESPPDDIVVVYGFESFSQEDWQALDIHRDVLQREGPVVFWLSKKDANTLCRYAPNLRSLIGRSFFELGPEGGLMTEQERTKRLQVLAEHYGLTDQEVIRRAQAGELPRDPEFAEWLVLLGRGDLV